MISFFDPTVPLVDEKGRPTEIFFTWLLSIQNAGKVLTVAKLPTASTLLTGLRSFVSDSNSTTFRAIVAGGGANGVPVFCDGTNWRIG